MPTIEIADEDWGGGSTQDIQRLIENVASHFDRHLEHPLPSGHIVVRRQPDGPPLIVYRDQESDPFTIRLPTQGCFWSQYAYQFAHEYFHFFSGYEELRGARHKWFEEVLGEVASMFALNQMSRTWLANPPYPNWTGYASSLGDYASELCSRPSRQLQPDSAIADLYRQNEAGLLADPYQRDLNGTFAIHLLPIFLDDPRRWELVRYLPICSSSFADFLRAWEDASPSHLRDGVTLIAAVFHSA
ncbi:MAG: hypothetical protein ACYDC1_03640 [Limisphaerales bacterium]